MSYFRSGDPLDDFDRLDREQARRLSRRPKCSQCDHPIQEEEAYYINSEWICERRMSDHLVSVDDHCE